MRLGSIFRTIATQSSPGLCAEGFTGIGAVGACAANRMLFSIGVRSWAKSFFTPASVSFKKPCASGRTSAPIGAGSTLAPREPTDWPTSGAKAAT
jgi:hypothetical protein